MLRIAGQLPDDISPGRYEMFLNLPDPAPSLRERPEYSIRLANKNVWDAKTGFNSLNHSIAVKASPGPTATPPVSSSLPFFRRISLDNSTRR
jgi:Domain of unknown function (DUF4832)